MIQKYNLSLSMLSCVLFVVQIFASETKCSDFTLGPLSTGLLAGVALTCFVQASMVTKHINAPVVLPYKTMACVSAFAAIACGSDCKRGLKPKLHFIAGACIAPLVFYACRQMLYYSLSVLL